MDKQQKQFLKQKRDWAVSLDPRMAELERRLLELGGEAVVFSHGPDDDLDKILGRGKTWDDHEIVRKSGRPSGCHSNSARLWEKKLSRQITSGYYLSDDGLWRQHSWVIEPSQKRLLETTCKGERYFGYVMDGNEAQEFAENNL